MMKKVLSRKMGKLEHLGTLLLVSYMPMVENKEADDEQRHIVLET